MTNLTDLSALIAAAVALTDDVEHRGCTDARHAEVIHEAIDAIADQVYVILDNYETRIATLEGA